MSWLLLERSSRKTERAFINSSHKHRTNYIFLSDSFEVLIAKSMQLLKLLEYTTGGNLEIKQMHFFDNVTCANNIFFS